MANEAQREKLVVKVRKALEETERLSSSENQDQEEWLEELTEAAEVLDQAIETVQEELG